ncbi:MAG: endonuclease domain-containing protein [Erythrobacter sp.]|nr:MAG: endonuclease domain-containing protein [Erythrobacter sp.]
MDDHTPESLKRARKLRKDMSLPEVLLWTHLRGKPSGQKFRKQHPLGDYVLDFYCAAKHLGIEVDGIAHDMGNRPARDSIRDDWLRGQGVEVMRVSASDVLKDASGTADAIVRYCAQLPPPSAAGAAATSPKGGGFTGASA